jgi:predicted RNA-binding Zn-ribbon protein involved in translation (DUF1610 family)
MRASIAEAMWKRNEMTGIARAWPSMTATWADCPQCGAAARIKSIVPHPELEKEDRTFECQECGLPRTYTMEVN